MICRYFTDANPKHCVLGIEEACEECGRFEPTEDDEPEERKCEACRWWADPNASWPGWGRCDRAGSSGRTALADSRFMILSSAWDEELRTRSDFGCVCWEGKR